MFYKIFKKTYLLAPTWALTLLCSILLKPKGAFAESMISAPSSDFNLPSLPSADNGSEGSTTGYFIKELIGRFVSGVLGIAATAAVIGIMYGGFQMMRGGESASKGKQSVIISIVGLLVIVMAYTIISLIVGLEPNDPDLGSPV